MGAKDVIVSLPSQNSAKIVKWKVEEGTIVYEGRVLLLYDLKSNTGAAELKKLKATEVGTVRKLLAKEGELVDGGAPLLELERGCSHPTVMNDLCAECGADLRRESVISAQASVPMVHSVPDLKVSEEQAQILGKADEERLLKDRKLVLLVDLDQTLIHTTNDNIPNNLRDVYHFQLYGPRSPWYHTRLRPGTQQFLSKVSRHYELHICTFGARNYAHMIAHFLDPDGKFFSHRILSRDECFNPNSKMANLKALFPCGDEMVCIIDDREDVWNFAPNLIHVKPYHFFQHTGDINAPPGLAKDENDEKEGFDFSQFAQGTSIRPKEPDPDKGKARSKRKEDSSESELEEGELSSKGGNQNQTEDQKEQVQEEETKSAEIKSEVDVSVNGNTISTCDEDSAMAIDDNKENTAEENSVSNENEKDVDKDKAKAESENKMTISNSEDKENCTKGSKNGEIKLVEQAKLVNDVIEIEESDDYLMYLEEILSKIHNFFYDIHDGKRDGDRDMKKVIPAVRGEVLAGTRLVFSGLVPTNQSLEQSRAYNIARSLGAEVSQDLTKDCTHVVAVRTGTAKVNLARRMKDVKLVTPDWLWTCAERWERVEEVLFTVGCERTGSRHPPPHCASPPHDTPAPRLRSPSGRFMDTINPLMTFSSEDIADMDAEVEDICNDESDDDSEAEERLTTVKKRRRKSPEGFGGESSSSSADSLAGDHIKGWGRKRLREEGGESDNESLGDKFRRGGELPSDVELNDDSVGSEEPPDEISDGDWNMMGAALEREFLEGE
uniref:RNA polymerase II subunit A C-terminal domain phosphatase n=1 Tax=Graphocephala atropunctata TaxID=36148 RepID=A0A1B6L9H7_9HEMI